MTAYSAPTTQCAGPEAATAGWLGNVQLNVIAAVLVNQLRAAATVDGQTANRTVRACVLVKPSCAYGYPPDLQDAAVRTVIGQAKRLAAR